VKGRALLFDCPDIMQDN